jgi:hypothetical protein
MTPRFGTPAVLLFAAALGWVLWPPRPAIDHDLTDLAVQQLHDDGSVASTLRDRHRGGWSVHVLAPVACATLGIAAVATGIRDARRRRATGGST